MATMPNALGAAAPIYNPMGALGNTASATNTGAVPTGSTATPSPTSTVQANTFAAPSAVAPAATTGAVDGGVPTGTTSGVLSPTGTASGSPSTIQTNGVNWVNGSNTVIGDFSDTYGAGTGQAITSVLQNMGTTNDSAIQALIAQTNTAANQQYGNIQAQEAAGGVTPNSSTAALASSNFYNQVNEGLQTNIGTMEQNQENTLLSTLVNEGAAHGGDPSLMDSIMGGIGDAATIGSDALSLGGLFSGGGSGSATSSSSTSD